MTSLTHSVRSSLLSDEQTFILTENGLASDRGGKSTLTPYAEIERIALIKYAGAGGHQAQLTARTKSGTKLKVRSHHYKSLGLFENRSSTYAPFVRELSSRVLIANPNASFTTGSTVMWFVWIFLFIWFVVIGALLTLALISGEELKGNVASGVVVCVIGCSFAWRGINRSRQGTFDATDPPPELIEL